MNYTHVYHWMYNILTICLFRSCYWVQWRTCVASKQTCFAFMKHCLSTSELVSNKTCFIFNRRSPTKTWPSGFFWNLEFGGHTESLISHRVNRLALRHGCLLEKSRYYGVCYVSSWPVSLSCACFAAVESEFVTPHFYVLPSPLPNKLLSGWGHFSFLLV